jgi:hypothetical protein
MIDPGNRERVAEGTLRAFLMGDGPGRSQWRTAPLGGDVSARRLVILVRSEAVSTGLIIGFDIDVTGIGNRE